MIVINQHIQDVLQRFPVCMVDELVLVGHYATMGQKGDSSAWLTAGEHLSTAFSMLSDQCTSFQFATFAELRATLKQAARERRAA